MFLNNWARSVLLMIPGFLPGGYSIMMAQNLIPNPSFEESTWCPNSSSELFYAVPWGTPSYGTPDYFKECATHPDYGVPANDFGYQDAHSGTAYAGALFRFSNWNGREYIRTPLTEPLVAGLTYSLSFWVSVADNYCGINQFGAYFSVAEPFVPDAGLLDFPAQITVTNSNTNAEEWTLISDCFVADGGESWIIIGNFTPDSGSPFNPGCVGDIAYYFIDDVSLVVANDGTFDLGQPVTACDEYIIIPGIPNATYHWEDGSTGETLTVTETGVYAVTITSFCFGVIDSLDVTIIGPSQVEIGPPEITFCEGESYDISLLPDTYNYEWQDGSTGPEFSITTSGIYSVTMNDGCHESSDQISVTVIPPPEPFSLGPNISICNGDDMEIWLDPASGDFIWQDGSTLPYFHITSPGIYSLTISNECGEDSDAIEVTLLLPPSFDLGPDSLDLCSGDTYDIYLDPAMGTFTWQDGSHESSISISSTGLYTITVENNCGSTEQSIFANYTASPVFDLGSDSTICNGETYLLDISGLAGDYMWQDGSTQSSLLVSEEGTYSISVTNQCGVYADTVMIVYLETPEINLPPAMNLCDGSSLILDAGDSEGLYEWSNGLQNDSILISSPGIYAVTVSNSCGIISDTVNIIAGGPLPFVSLGNDLSICAGDVVLLSPASNDVTAWLWPDGSTDTTYTISSPGIIVAQVSNNCGLSSDTMIVSLLPAPPSPALGPDTMICPGETFLLTINILEVDILWPDGSAGPDFLVTDAGNYYASVSNECGSASDSMNVSLLSPAPILDLGIDQFLCPGESITFDPGINDVDYMWHDGSAASVFTSTEPGTISLTIINDCGNASDTLEIIEDTNGPVLNLGDDVLGCEGDTIILRADISGVDYLWQDGSILSDFVTTVSGTYILQASNACGVDVDTIEVNIEDVAPAVSLGPDTMICEGFTLQLLSHQNANTSVQWQDGSVQPEFTVYSSGIYFLTASNHCGVASDTVEVSFQQAPDMFELGPDTVLCPGGSFLIHAPSTTALLTWQDGSHETSFLANQEQTYSLRLSNFCGEVGDELSVTIDTRTPVIGFDPQILLCPGETITLDATQVFDVAFLWNTGSILSSIQITTPGIYRVSITTVCLTAQQDVEVAEDPFCNNENHNEIYIPNVFSPNGDLINDVFTLFFGSTLEVLTIDGSIFDRWGNLVFNSTGIPFIWDGRFGQEDMMPGVYVFQFKVKYTGSGLEQEKLFKGNITLIR